MAVLYIYLGRKGGGAEFNRLMREYFMRNQVDDAIFLNSRAVQLEFQHNNQLNISIFTPSKIIDLPRHLFSLMHSLIKIMKVRNEFKTTVLLMASPWDLPIIRFIKLLRKKVIFLVHDLQPHPGENWPRKNSIAKRINLSEQLVFLGSSTANQYMKSTEFKLKPRTIINHPVFYSDRNIVQRPMETESDSYLLFIGRIKEYKGLGVLNEALHNLEDKRIRVLIAGEGKLTLNFPNNVEVINKWLSQTEIIEYISNAKAVIFPYTEASQSGLIPLCMVMQKYLIISDVSGLVSQTSGYAKISKFKSGDSQDLAEILARISEFSPFSADSKSDKGSLILTEGDFALKLHEFALNCD